MRVCTSAPPKLFGRHFFAGRRFHERRSAKEDRSVAFDDDRFVAHRGHVRAARGARAHHRRDLRNPFARHARLIVEDAAEVIAIRENVGLQRKKRAARIDQIDARQMILLGDLLRAQMFLHGHRIVRAAFDGRVVRDDDAVLAFDDADAGDDRRPTASRRCTCRLRRARRTRGSPSRCRRACRCVRAPSACRACGVWRRPRVRRRPRTARSRLR